MRLCTTHATTPGTPLERDLRSLRRAFPVLLATGAIGAGLAAAAPTVIGRLVGSVALVGVLVYLTRTCFRSYRALSHLRHEQERVAEAKRQFVSTVSHDFRSPLTAICGFTELLCDETREIPPLRQREYLRVVREQSQSLARMIEDTVDLSRLEEGRLPIKPAVYTIASLLEDTLSRLDHASDRSRITVVIEEGTPSVCVDQFELEQVFDRMLCAALTSSEGAAPIMLHASPRGEVGGVRVAVHAPGLNTSEDQFRPLFGDAESAFTLGRQNQRHLAMATSRAIVELHGGRVSADEETTLAVSLPAAKSSEQGTPEAKARRGALRLISTAADKP